MWGWRARLCAQFWYPCMVCLCARLAFYKAMGWSTVLRRGQARRSIGNHRKLHIIGNNKRTKTTPLGSENLERGT